jgi:hypothetical protein
VKGNKKFVARKANKMRIFVIWKKIEKKKNSTLATM